MNKQSKRTFIKAGLASTFAITGILPILTSVHAAEAKSPMFINALIDTLRSTNNPVCNAAADKLLLLKGNKVNYDLHLRSADLNTNEIRKIAAAIKAVHNAGGPSLQSFSMSYNPDLRDEGVFILAKALPPTLTEIGLVQCGISDEGSDALIALAAKASKLHWLCVEQNSFSKDAKEKFTRLGQERNGLLVIV